MPDCSRLAKCIFFNDQMTGMPAMADMYKQHYCKGQFDECARFTVASKLGPERVPGNLFPNDTKRAQQLINS
jgi:hypothetical protein